MPTFGRIAAAVLVSAMWFAPAPAHAQDLTTEPTPDSVTETAPPSTTTAAPTRTPADSETSGISVLTLAAVARSGKPEFRTTTLVCAPEQTGTHPDPGKACAELVAAEGDFAALTAEPAACPMIYEPVSLLVIGLWDSKPVTYQHEFSNWCALANAAEHVYKF